MSLQPSWQLRIRRDDATMTELREVPLPVPGDGEVRMRSSLTAITANSIAYAELGDELRYYDFFPADEEGWGTPPMWGFADVEASNVEGVEVGARYYGFIPSASHFLVQPRVMAQGKLRDERGLRGELPPSYSTYLDTRTDPSYHPADREDLQVIFRPLYITSWALADTLRTADYYGAEQLVFSSASAKTAYGTAWNLAQLEERPRLVGLTSVRNRAFVEDLGCYDEVRTYDELGLTQPGTRTAYVDFAGSLALRESLSARIGTDLVAHVVAGLTHHEGIITETSVSDPAPWFWFCPDYLASRSKELGPGQLDAQFSAAYPGALAALGDKALLERLDGPEGLQQAWDEVVSGTTSPGAVPVVRL